MASQKVVKVLIVLAAVAVALSVAGYVMVFLRTAVAH